MRGEVGLERRHGKSENSISHVTIVTTQMCLHSEYIYAYT